MKRSAGPRGESGVALLVVLWGCTLAAITLGALASSARVEGVQARSQYERVKGSYAAEAGIEQAVYRLYARQAVQRWAVDGRTYRFREGDAEVSVSVVDEDGKVNLNQTTPERISALLRAIGVVPEQVPAMRDAIVGWGKRNDSFSDSLLAAGGLTSLEELRRIPGLPVDVAERLDPAVTLWSTSGPNLAHAPAAVVAAITGAGREASEAYVADVQAMAPGNDALPRLPNGAEGEFNAVDTSGTVTITSTATTRGGQVVRIRATVRLAPGTSRGYSVMRWRESGAQDPSADPRRA